jgi:hypothetical protein
MAQSFPFPRQWKSARSSESFLDNGHRIAETDLAVSIAQVPATSEVSLPTKRRGRCKMSPPRSSISKEMKSYDNILKNQHKHSASLQDRALLKVK